MTTTCKKCGVTGKFGIPNRIRKGWYQMQCGGCGHWQNIYKTNKRVKA